MRFPVSDNAVLKISRRRLGALAAISLGLASLGGCQNETRWHSTDVTGVSAPLEFTMTRASDGKTVTAADYRGKVTMLYFGYTFCPDVCPTTLFNVAQVLKALGPDAEKVRFLFVTVDPNRDSLPILAAYVKNFAPQIVGLRGQPDQLAQLARRYRVAYSVTPKTKDHDYEVSHSSVIYVFDQKGAARLLISSLDSTSPDIKGVTEDLRRLIESNSSTGILGRILHFV